MTQGRLITFEGGDGCGKSTQLLQTVAWLKSQGKDVLQTFEPGDSLGDIVISAEQAAKQASQHGLDLDLEIKQLILHGLLHLCGYDHETDDGEMDSRETELRGVLGIA